jgi:hypothetical protein
MTMMSPAHPDPERLAALAGADPEALADSTLTDHLAGCLTCGQQVRELSSLRAALAELPDLAPSRPLQLVPAVSAPAAQAGWRIALRRAFAPVAVAGMVLLLVGGIGATGSLGPADAQQLIPLPFQSAARPAAEDALPDATSTDERAAPAATAPADTDAGALAPTPDSVGGAAGGAEGDSDGSHAEGTPAPVQGNDLLAETTVTSGWILVALVGLGLLVVALVLRLAAVKPTVPGR